METAASGCDPAAMSSKLRTAACMGVVAASIALPGSASAFHHGSIPAADCAASDMASNNPTARNAILVQNPVKDPGIHFPPFDTPGENQADPNCAGAR